MLFPDVKTLGNILLPVLSSSIKNFKQKAPSNSQIVTTKATRENVKKVLNKFFSQIGITKVNIYSLSYQQAKVQYLGKKVEHTIFFRCCYISQDLQTKKFLVLCKYLVKYEIIIGVNFCTKILSILKTDKKQLFGVIIRQLLHSYAVFMNINHFHIYFRL